MAFRKLWSSLQKPSKKSNPHRTKPESGFTLIEILVSLIVGSIVISGLLFLVIELMQLDRREDALTRTQQDMRRALAYIDRDVREAVYVYENPNDIATELADDQEFPTGADVEPILAFWRPDPIDDVSVIDPCSSTTSEATCEVLKVRQITYTLVVYLQKKNAAGDIWEGPTRIIRYQLPQFTQAGLKTVTEVSGYVDPSPDNFVDWEKATGETPAGSSAALVDFVDFMDQTPPVSLESCPSGYARTPDLPADGNSFFVCVRSNTAINADIGGSSNQDIIAYIRGNTDGRHRFLAPASQQSRTPTLKAQVLVRGILDKRFE